LYRSGKPPGAPNRQEIKMGKKILIVEDHPDARRVFSLILGSAGHETREAENANEGLKKTLSEPPDLILMDVSLPDVRGFELAKRIKDNPATTKIPIVACSGWTQSEVRVKAQEVGIVEFLTKPFAATKLVEAVERHT
jgi:CheY-like chemotaxis protein